MPEARALQGKQGQRRPAPVSVVPKCFAHMLPFVLGVQARE